MSFMDRAIQPDGYLMPAIPVTESALYHGSGNAIAYVEQDQIVKLLYLHDEDDLKVITDSVVGNECYLGMCSSHEFCDPRLLTLDDVVGYARLARLHGEEWGDEGDD
tara:strand:- start:1414 stop:1734 length:321 start_codon:yes stop_codon:yes gene_type:complete